MSSVATFLIVGPNGYPTRRDLQEVFGLAHYRSSSPLQGERVLATVAAGA